MYVTRLSRRFISQTSHQILGLSQNASQKEIKQAYFKLAKQYHPDVYKGNPELFKKINEAYSNLTSPLGSSKLDPYSYPKPSEDISPEKEQAYRQAFYWKMQEEHKKYEQRYGSNSDIPPVDIESVNRYQNLLLLATGLLILVPVIIVGRTSRAFDQKNLRETLEIIEENERDMLAFRQYEQEINRRRSLKVKSDVN